MKDYAAALWPAVDPAKLLHRLLSEPDALARAADGLLDEDEAAALGASQGLPGTTPWSLADAVLLDEAADLVERTPSLGHIVVDEAQDLSPMMLRAIGRRSATGSLTVLGDLAQATTRGRPGRGRTRSGTRQARGARGGVFRQGFRVPEGHRVRRPAAAAHRPDLAPAVRAAQPRRAPGPRHRDPPGHGHRGAGPRGLGRADRAGPARRRDHRAGGRDPARRARSRRPDEPLETEFDTRLDIVPASLAKGLEFDHVVLLEPEAIVAGPAGSPGCVGSTCA